jgi:hypothetical protein
MGIAVLPLTFAHDPGPGRGGRRSTTSGGRLVGAEPVPAGSGMNMRSDCIGPRRKVYLDAGFSNLAESTVGLSSTFSTYVVMLSAGLTPTTRTMYGTFTPPTSR